VGRSIKSLTGVNWIIQDLNVMHSRIGNQTNYVKDVLTKIPEIYDNQELYDKIINYTNKLTEVTDLYAEIAKELHNKEIEELNKRIVKEV